MLLQTLFLCRIIYQPPRPRPPHHPHLEPDLELELRLGDDDHPDRQYTEKGTSSMDLKSHDLTLDICHPLYLTQYVARCLSQRLSLLFVQRPGTAPNSTFHAWCKSLCCAQVVLTPPVHSPTHHPTLSLPRRQLGVRSHLRVELLPCESTRLMSSFTPSVWRH